MTLHNINDILSKISELRAVFVLGHRAVPFIEEVLYFLKEITPLMDEINVSLTESTHSMPHATSQLTSVSKATELATTEILDLVDEVFAKIEYVGARRKEITTVLDQREAEDTKMLEILRAGLSDREGLLEEVEAFFARKETSLAPARQAMLDQAATLDSVRDRMNRIMISLQVQDITSQQIASVNHVIESIRKKLDRLAERLTTGSFDSVDEHLDLGPGTFDSQARYDRSGKLQATVDQIINGHRSVSAPGENQPDPSDIDALFAEGANAFPSSQQDIDALFGENTSSNARASREEIDLLFSSPDEGDADRSSQHAIDAKLESDNDAGIKASQDDIDRLFGG